MKKVDMFIDEVESYYYLSEEGSIYNSKTKKELKLFGNTYYKLRTKEGKTKTFPLKKLYKSVYGKVFCIDKIDDLKGEIWKAIEGAEEKYFCSNYGRIKSYCGYEAIIVEPYITKKGYCKVKLTQFGIVVNRYIHRIVKETFDDIENKEFYQVHHKDFNSLNNKLSNLIWVTPSEHIKIHNERRKNEDSTEPKIDTSK